jgi:hypothetical protein
VGASGRPARSEGGEGVVSAEEGWMQAVLGAGLDGLDGFSVESEDLGRQMFPWEQHTAEVSQPLYRVTRWRCVCLGPL